MSASRDAHCLVRFSLKSARKRERICRHHRDFKYFVYEIIHSIRHSHIIPHSVAHCLVSNSRDPAARCWQRGSSSFHRKNVRLSAFAIVIAIFNNDSSLPTSATTVPTCVGHLRIVPVSVFRVETKNTFFMIYPMHNWAPYWLFTMVYACVPHFNLWRGHRHPCSFQLRIALNLKSTRHYMGIDLVPYAKSRTSAQHNCKI